VDVVDREAAAIRRQATVRIGPSHFGSHCGEDVGRRLASRRVGLDCIDLRVARYALKEGSSIPRFSELTRVRPLRLTKTDRICQLNDHGFAGAPCLSLKSTTMPGRAETSSATLSTRVKYG
jgi:hypothetical protein